jgi:protein-tyrosine phosphatase
MLQLAGRVEYPDIVSLYLPVEDFAPLNFDLLDQGVAFIREQRKQDRRILVACGAGINRSSAYCAAALKVEEGWSLIDSFKEIKHRHPESLPHEPVWLSLCRYFNETTPYLDVMRLGFSRE